LGFFCFQLVQGQGKDFTHLPKPDLAEPYQGALRNLEVLAKNLKRRKEIRNKQVVSAAELLQAQSLKKNGKPPRKLDERRLFCQVKSRAVAGGKAVFAPVAPAAYPPKACPFDRPPSPGRSKKELSCIFSYEPVARGGSLDQCD
jgi:hypothetical protein